MYVKPGKKKTVTFQGCLLDFSLTGGRLNRWRLFLLMRSEIGTVWVTSRSFTYVLYLSRLSFSIWNTVYATAESVMFLLSSTRRSLLLSKNVYFFYGCAQIFHKLTSSPSGTQHRHQEGVLSEKSCHVSGPVSTLSSECGPKQRTKKNPCQGLYVELEISLSHCSHIDHHIQLQLQDDGPEK